MPRSFVVALAAVAIIAAPAKASCWKADQVAAAKARDLETMLMVSALRCRFSGGDMLVRYNRFVVQSRGALTQVNDTLRTHFSEAVGQRASLDAYDSYVTAIANRYGAGASGLNCNDLSAITDAALSEGATFRSLADLAERAGTTPVLDGGSCAVTMATR